MLKKYPIIIFLLSIFLYAIPPLSAQQGVTYYVNVKAAKMRSAPKATAKLITTLGRGKAVVVLEVVTGDKVGNVDTWYKVNASGKEGYILSSLLTDRAPTAPTAKPNNNNTTSNANNNNSPVIAPTNEPVSPIPAAPQGVSCGGASTCSQMSSCAQAYACLQAGNGKLDKDKDGVPCESICS